MNRRDFLKYAGLTAVGTVMSSCVNAEQKQVRAGKKPNIIFILADDLGYGDLSCYGQEKFRTPILIRWQQRGCDLHSITRAVRFVLRRGVFCLRVIIRGIRI